MAEQGVVLLPDSTKALVLIPELGSDRYKGHASYTGTES